MSGTGRRRKPPAGEESEAQYAPPSYEQPQYQAHAQEAEPQYDYDWRQPAEGPAQPAASQQSPVQQNLSRSGSFDAFQPQQPPTASPPPPAAAAQPAAAPTVEPQYQPPQAAQSAQSPPRPQPQVQPQSPPPPPQSAQPPAPPQYDPYQRQGYVQQPPQAPEPPQPPLSQQAQQQGYAQVPRQRPEPKRPEPKPAAAFEFEFDPDEPDEPQLAASAASTASAQSAPSAPVVGNRPADKDGYRPDDFAFVDQADEPDVKGWLSFSETRADTRAERVRKMRFRLIAGGVVLVLIAVGIGVYVLLGGGVPGLSAQDQATKSMILFQLDDTQGDAVGDALLVTQRGGETNGTATGTGAVVVIPAQMQIDDQGFGTQTFGGNMASQQPPAGADTVSDVLGVTPDGVWPIDETTFGIFVDELGGLAITTNTAVPATPSDPKGVSVGSVTLTGQQAVAYATYQAPGEPAAAQATRFGQVMDALLAKMPSYANSVQQYLKDLGLISSPSLPLTKISPILAALAAQQSTEKLTVATLPLATDGSNALNYSGAVQIITKLLGGTAKAGASAGQAARVLVQNGTGASTSASAQLLGSAQAKLTNAGLTFNAGNTVAAQAHTVVEVGSSAQQALGEQIAASLGLSGSSVQVVSGLSSVDDVTVVLGQDWSGLSTQ